MWNRRNLVAARLEETRETAAHRLEKFLVEDVSRNTRGADLADVQSAGIVESPTKFKFSTCLKTHTIYFAYSYVVMYMVTGNMLNTCGKSSRINSGAFENR